MTTVRDLEVWYEVHGEGPPLLNISGSGGDLRTRPVDRFPLNRVRTVISYDQRGLGRTSAPPGEWTMADYADDAAALLDVLGRERVDVMGTSFGGMVALNLAVRHPHRIRRLVLNCTSPGGEAPSAPLHTFLDRPTAEVLADRMRGTDTRWDPDADEPVPDLPPGVYQGMVDDAAGWERPTDGFRRQLLARAGHDVVDDLGSIPAETLICAGRFDGTAPPANSELMAERMPNARLELFDGGHLFLFQDRRSWKEIAAFLTT